MKWNLPISLMLAALLFSYAQASPIDEQDKLVNKSDFEFEELKDLESPIGDEALEEIKNSPLFYPHRDEDQLSSLKILAKEPSLKYDFELLESRDIKKESTEIEERFRGAALRLDTDSFTDEDIETNVGQETKQNPYITLTLMASAMFLIAFIAYTALIVWRRHLEQRYGTRVLLVAACDDDDHNMPTITNSHSRSNHSVPLRSV